MTAINYISKLKKRVSVNYSNYYFDAVITVIFYDVIWKIYLLLGMKDSCLYKSGNPDLSKYPAEYRRKNVMKQAETLYFSYSDHFPSAAVSSVMIVMVGRTTFGVCAVSFAIL